MGLCKSLIDGTKALTEIVVTFINEVLWNLSTKSYSEQVLKQLFSRKWQDYVYIQCEYKSTKQKIKHLLREENKVKENKIS